MLYALIQESQLFVAFRVDLSVTDPHPTSLTDSCKCGIPHGSVLGLVFFPL